MYLGFSNRNEIVGVIGGGVNHTYITDSIIWQKHHKNSDL
jgi:hypothetical protein